MSKLYDDYLTLLHRSGWNYSLEMLQSFSTSQASLFLSITSMQVLTLQLTKKPFNTPRGIMSSFIQVNYILGDNPMKMSYMVGIADYYPTQVHHRSTSIPWDGQYHSCDD